MSRRRILSAAVVALLCWWPRLAVASPCIADLLDLEDDERARLRAVVCGPDTTGASELELAPILRKLVAHGGWQVGIAVDIARGQGGNFVASGCDEGSAIDPRGAQSWATCTLRQLLDAPRCELAERVEAGLEGMRADGLPRAIAAEDLAGLGRACRGAVSSDSLDNLRSKHVVVAYYGGPNDQIDAIVGASLPWVVDTITYRGRVGTARFLVLPQAVPAGIVVTQADLDVPWIQSVSPLEDIALRSREQECLDLEFAIDAEWTDWAVFSGGRVVEMVVGQGTPSRVARATIEVGVDPSSSAPAHEVIVADGEGWSKHFTVPRAAIVGRCEPVRADLRGRTRERVALTRVDVESSCGDLTVEHINEIVTHYFESHAIDVRQFGALAEIMRTFALAEAELARGSGASRGELDARAELEQIAGEMLRQSVSSLLTIEVRCEGAHPVVVATNVDLNEFGERRRTPIMGVDLNHVLKSESLVLDGRESLRDGLQDVLGALYGHTIVRLVEPPLLVDYYDHVDLDYAVTRNGEAGEGADVVEFGMAHIEHDERVATICHDVEQLGRGSEASPRAVVGHIDRLSAESLLVDRRIAVESSLHDRVSLPLTRPGRYLIWMRTSDGTSLSARCIRAVSSRVAVYLQGGGLAQPELDATHVATFRLELGVAYPFGRRKTGRAGALAGYHYTRRRVDEVVEIGRPAAWSRHGFALGAFVGFDVPVSRCVHRPSAVPDSRCASVAMRSWSVAGNLGVGAGLGLFDLPTALNVLPGVRRHDIDFELAAQLMLKVQLNARTSFYVFQRVSLMDAFSGPRKRDPSNRGLSAVEVVNDFGVVTVLGAGVAWVIRKR